jgi:uncharacterized Zn ribbon protein
VTHHDRCPVCKSRLWYDDADMALYCPGCSYERRLGLGSEDDDLLGEVLEDR